MYFVEILDVLKFIYLILIYFSLYIFFYNSIFMHINLFFLILFNNKTFIIFYEILSKFLYKFKFFILTYKPFPHFFYKKSREGRYGIESMTFPTLAVLIKLNKHNDIFFK